MSLINDVWKIGSGIVVVLAACGLATILANHIGMIIGHLLVRS